jgi:predicted DNA-binding protein (MmcQ/YjbR family)
MDIESFREYCLSKPGVTEDLPFDEFTLAFRVGGKIFSLCDVSTFDGINLKCDPEQAIEWREQYSGVLPGYHMNKRHWNTVATAGDVPDKILRNMIDHSYDLVLASLPRKTRASLGL